MQASQRAGGRREGHIVLDKMRPNSDILEPAIAEQFPEPAARIIHPLRPQHCKSRQIQLVHIECH